MVAQAFSSSTQDTRAGRSLEFEDSLFCRASLRTGLHRETVSERVRRTALTYLCSEQWWAAPVQKDIPASVQKSQGLDIFSGFGV